MRICKIYISLFHIYVKNCTSKQVELWILVNIVRIEKIWRGDNDGRK